MIESLSIQAWWCTRDPRRSLHASPSIMKPFQATGQDETGPVASQSERVAPRDATRPSELDIVSVRHANLSIEKVLQAIVLVTLRAGPACSRQMHECADAREPSSCWHAHCAFDYRWRPVARDEGDPPFSWSLSYVLGIRGSNAGLICYAPNLHIVAPPLQQSSIALLMRGAPPRHRAPAATCCPEPRLCRLQPASERWSTRFT